MTKTIAAVRVRGRAHIRSMHSDTLKMLGLTRKNHCTFVSEENLKKMIKNAKDYLTYGPIDEKTIEKLRNTKDIIFVKFLKV